MNATTIRHVIERFISNGNRVVSRKGLCGRKLSQNAINIIEYIRSPQRLQEWAPLSLRERVEIITSTTEMKTNPS